MRAKRFVTIYIYILYICNTLFFCQNYRIHPTQYVQATFSGDLCDIGRLIDGLGTPPGVQTPPGI